ncbi:MAG: hypothetical protein M5R40_06160 [Anaerolineae bacterium]|nr:hypothetical protein [Anaerolineae bacterium]
MTPALPNERALREQVCEIGRLMRQYSQPKALEQVAKVTLLTQLLGGAKPLLPEQIEKLIALRRSFGFPGLYT